MKQAKQLLYSILQWCSCEQNFVLLEMEKIEEWENSKTRRTSRVFYQEYNFSFLFFIYKIMGMNQITVLIFLSLAPLFDKHKTFQKTSINILN